jgi:PAS domain S-box-containing protein
VNFKDFCRSSLVKHQSLPPESHGQLTARDQYLPGYDTIFEPAETPPAQPIGHETAELPKEPSTREQNAVAAGTDAEVTREVLLKAGALQGAIFSSANFSCIATDQRGVIQLFNVGAERMLGYSSADVLDNVTPADISDPYEVIARAKALSLEFGNIIAPGFEALAYKASRGIEDAFELTQLRKDGSRFPAIMSVTALRNAQGGIIGYLFIGTDDTARRKAEAEVNKLEQRLRDQQFYTRSLIESSVDALVATDPLGIITDVNKQMEVITGCPRDALIGAPFKNFFTDPKRAEAGITLTLDEKKVTDYELTARASNGRKTVLSCNAATVCDRDRKLRGVLVTARDVTDQKLSEQALREANVELETARVAAEKASRAKSDFLSSMGQELRRPLNAILGLAQMIEPQSQSPAPSQNRGMAQILETGGFLLNLINEFLDLAVIESGKMPLSIVPVSLPELMLECRDLMELEAQKRGIRMTFPNFPNPVLVSGDRARLKQIIVSLLSNAIKYNKDQGTVVVDCPATGSQRVRFSVTDTGAGLPPEKMAQLFTPFDRPGRENGGVAGSGIGLVVTKRLTELMGGALGGASTVGVGSVFWCEMNSAGAPPISVQNGDASDTVQANATACAPRRTLLYVEDNPANLKLVEEVIALTPDLELIAAVNGTLGIQLARATQPRVILMDINAPDVGGVKTLKILRQDADTAHIPIIALSANPLPRDIAKIPEAGFFRSLTKPITMIDLNDTLNAALDFAENRLLEAVNWTHLP